MSAECAPYKYDGWSQDDFLDVIGELRVQLADAQQDRAKLIEALRHVINQAVANDSLFMQFTDNRRVGDLLTRLTKKDSKT
jgi:hypothetical protein